MRCRTCDAPLDEDARFCTNCGAEVLSERKPPCHECGRVPGLDDRFCLQCGSVLESGGEAAPAPVAADWLIEPDSPDLDELPRAPAELDGTATARSTTSTGGSPDGSPRSPRATADDAEQSTPTSITETARHVAAEPAPAVRPSDETRGGHRAEEPAGRGRLMGWAAVTIVVLGLAGWGGWTLLGPDNSGGDEVPDATATSTTSTVAASVTATSTATSTSTFDLTQCLAIVETHAVEAIAWVAGLRAELLTTPPSLSPTATVDELTDLGCDEEEAESQYLQAIEERATRSGGMTWLGLAAAHLAGLDHDPATLVAAAAAAFPDQGVFAPIANGEALPSWIVIFESLEVGEYTHEDANNRAQPYGNLGKDIGVLLSSDYGSLNAGYWVIFARGYATSQEASAACAEVRSSVDFCYSRYLSQLPLTTGAYAVCGEFGRFTVRADADAHTQPNRNQSVLTTVRVGEELYAAGIPESADGTIWIPVVVSLGVGWVMAADVEPDPGCAGAATRPVPDTCNSVVDEATVLLEAVAANPVVPDADQHAQRLVARAAALSCDAVAVNVGISERLWPEPEFTDESLHLAVFAFQPFLTDA